MKNLFMMIFALLSLTLLLSGCSSDDEGGDTHSVSIQPVISGVECTEETAWPLPEYYEINSCRVANSRPDGFDYYAPWVTIVKKTEKDSTPTVKIEWLRVYYKDPTTGQIVRLDQAGNSHGLSPQGGIYERYVEVNPATGEEEICWFCDDKHEDYTLKQENGLAVIRPSEFSPYGNYHFWLPERLRVPSGVTNVWVEAKVMIEGNALIKIGADWTKYAEHKVLPAKVELCGRMTDILHCESAFSNWAENCSSGWMIVSSPREGTSDCNPLANPISRENSPNPSPPPAGQPAVSITRGNLSDGAVLYARDTHSIKVEGDGNISIFVMQKPSGASDWQLFAEARTNGPSSYTQDLTIYSDWPLYTPMRIEVVSGDSMVHTGTFKVHPPQGSIRIERGDINDGEVFYLNDTHEICVDSDHPVSIDLMMQPSGSADWQLFAQVNHDGSTYVCQDLTVYTDWPIFTPLTLWIYSDYEMTTTGIFEVGYPPYTGITPEPVPEPTPQPEPQPQPEPIPPPEPKPDPIPVPEPPPAPQQITLMGNKIENGAVYQRGDSVNLCWLQDNGNDQVRIDVLRASDFTVLDNVTTSAPADGCLEVEAEYGWPLNTPLLYRIKAGQAEDYTGHFELTAFADWHFTFSIVDKPLPTQIPVFYNKTRDTYTTVNQSDQNLFWVSPSDYVLGDLIVIWWYDSIGKQHWGCQANWITDSAEKFVSMMARSPSGVNYEVYTVPYTHPSEPLEPIFGCDLATR